MNSIHRWLRAFPAHLVLVALLSLSLVSAGDAAKLHLTNAQRELKSLLQTKHVLVTQKQAAEQTARQYGYYQKPGSRGSGSSRSPGGTGR